MTCKCGHAMGRHYSNDEETEFFECLEIVDINKRMLCSCKKYEEKERNSDGI